MLISNQLQPNCFSHPISSHHHLPLTVFTVAADESLYLKAIFSETGSFDLQYVPQHGRENDVADGHGDAVSAVYPSGSSSLSPSSPLPRVVGWETNERYA